MAREDAMRAYNEGLNNSTAVAVSAVYDLGFNDGTNSVAGDTVEDAPADVKGVYDAGFADGVKSIDIAEIQAQGVTMYLNNLEEAAKKAAPEAPTADAPADVTAAK